MELCCALDQHEPLYSDLYAGKLADRRRDELVAGDIDDLSGQYHRACPDDLKWPGGREVWDPVPRICPCELWSAGCEYPRDAACDRGLRMVWYPDLDRGVRAVSAFTALDSFFRAFALAGARVLGIGNRSGDLFPAVLASEYVGGLAGGGEHPETARL